MSQTIELAEIDCRRGQLNFMKVLDDGSGTIQLPSKFLDDRINFIFHWGSIENGKREQVRFEWVTG